MGKKIKKYLRIFFFLPWSIIFNFRYLPLRQAIKLPIIFYVRPTFLSLKGKVIIDSTSIRFNMIKLGKKSAPMLPYEQFRWENKGIVIFKGSCSLSNHCFVSCGSEGSLKFGDKNTFSFGCRIIAWKGIAFEDKVRVSWDCTFIDTDFHPLIDMIRQEPLKMSQAIKIGYGSWIGHNCILSKGVRLPHNTIVASGSVVKGIFHKENTIIGGNFATVLDEGYIRDDA